MGILLLLFFRLVPMHFGGAYVFREDLQKETK